MNPCRAEPDLEFEGLLKRQHTRVKYFQGSLMNAMDLERAKVKGENFLFTLYYHLILRCSLIIIQYCPLGN